MEAAPQKEHKTTQRARRKKSGSISPVFPFETRAHKNGPEKAPRKIGQHFPLIST
jgi:hypothetical protein